MTSLGARKGGMSVDVMGSELGCDFFDDIFKWVVGKVTCEKPFKKLLLNSLVLNTSPSQNCILGMECLSNYQQETNADQVKPRPPLITDHIYKGPILV